MKLLGVAARVATRLAVLAGGVLASELVMLGASTPRLRKAPGPTSGRKDPKPNAGRKESAAKALRVLVFGDSVACGCGCPSNERAFAGACTQGLAERTKRAVEYDVLGVIGYTAADMTANLVPKISRDASYDAVIISCGVNHVLGLHSRARYEAELTELLSNLRTMVGQSCVIMLMRMPPMDKFPQVSYLQPLNLLIGYMASNIDEGSKAVCSKQANTLGPLACVGWNLGDALSFTRRQIEKIMAPDGFHPSYEACAYAGDPLADAFMALSTTMSANLGAELEADDDDATLVSFDSFDPASRRAHYTVKHALSPDGCLPMWVADMELGTAPSIQAALRARMDHPTFGYTIQPTLIWTRVARWLSTRHDWSGLSPNAFIFTPNLVSSTVNGLRAFTQRGDAVCMLLPLYHPLQDLVEKEGRKLIPVDLSLVEGTGTLDYEIDLGALRAALANDKLKLLIWCSPHNPSGRVWTREELTHVVELAREFGVRIISDEIHSDLVLPSSGKKHVPLAYVARSLGYEHMVMTMSGPGKTWNVAGCHSGFVVMESSAMRKRYMDVVGHAYLSYGSTFATTTMLAAYANVVEVQEEQQQQEEERGNVGSAPDADAGAVLRQNLTDPAKWLDDVLKYLDRNIDLVERFVAERLPRIRVMRPEASFLVWLDCRAMGMTGEQLDLFFTNKAKVFLSSGGGFGGKHASGFMRMNVACPRSFLVEALDRIARAYDNAFPAGKCL